MASPVVITIPHQLGAAEAKRRMETGLGQMTAGVQGLGEFDQNWQGDRLDFSARAMGQTITGSAHVFDDSVRLEMVLPGFLGMLANQVKSKVEQKGRILLEGPKK